MKIKGMLKDILYMNEIDIPDREGKDGIET